MIQKHDNNRATINVDPVLLEKVLMTGDLSGLEPNERLAYIKAVCDSLNINPLTRPLEYIEFEGKLLLYARKDATEQLRKNNAISLQIISKEVVNDIYVVTSRATTPDGRTDESTGAVPLIKEDVEWLTTSYKNKDGSPKKTKKRLGTYSKLSPEDLANAFMKAETKSKRRVTLSICGLGILDESELDTMRGAKYINEENANHQDSSPSAKKKPKTEMKSQEGSEVTQEALPDLKDEKVLDFIGDMVKASTKAQLEIRYRKACAQVDSDVAKQHLARAYDKRLEQLGA